MIVAKTFEIDAAGVEEIVAMIRANHRLQTSAEQGHTAVEILRLMVADGPPMFDGECHYCGVSGNMSHHATCLYGQAKHFLESLE